MSGSYSTCWEHCIEQDQPGGTNGPHGRPGGSRPQEESHTLGAVGGTQSFKEEVPSIFKVTVNFKPCSLFGWQMGGARSWCNEALC